jgi:hypothetical protein
MTQAMSESVIDDLAALRKAAAERDPNRTQFLLKRLLLNMTFYRGLALAVERAYAFLPTFERYYPQAIWARQVLVQIASLGTAPGDIPAEARQAFTSPGAANYVKVLYDLAHATRQSQQMEARIGYLTSAVVNTIMAELVEAWYGGRLSDWERVRQNQFDPATGQYSDPEATQIAYRFWTDEDTAQRDTAAWLAVADSVEEKMQRG